MPELLDTLQEYQQVSRVLRAFEAGGRIVNISVATFPPALTPEEMAAGASPPMLIMGTIDTRDIDYPPQMIEAIKTTLMERQKKIAEELEVVGVIVPVELMR